MSETAQEKLLGAIFGRKTDALPQGELISEETPTTLTDAGKEQVKLRANFFNVIGIALFGVGGLAPLVKAFSDQSSSSGALLPTLFLSSVCFVISVIIHLHAYRHLNGLDE